MTLDEFIVQGHQIWHSDKYVELVASFITEKGESFFCRGFARNCMTKDKEDFAVTVEKALKEMGEDTFKALSRVLEKDIKKEYRIDKDFEWFQLSINPQLKEDEYYYRTFIPFIRN